METVGDSPGQVRHGTDPFHVIARIPRHRDLSRHAEWSSGYACAGGRMEAVHFFLVVENDWLYGSGLADMKGGLAALIAAAAAVMNARE